MVKFTKKQQRLIDNQTDPRAKENWIEHFTHIQEMKQMPEHKEFIKVERIKERLYKS